MGTADVPADEGNARELTEKQSQLNYLWTVLLNVGLFFIAPVMLFVGLFGLGQAKDQCHFAPSCIERVDALSIVLLGGLIGGFILAVGLSILLLRRGKLAFYAPIVAGVAMYCLVIILLNMSDL